MFKSIYIDNFKALQSIDIDFNQINVLIGANASGKTTILQAMDFLFNCVSRDVPEYLKDRAWSVNDIKSQCVNSRLIVFESVVTLDVDGEEKELLWDIYFRLNASDGTITLHSESLKDRKEFFRYFPNSDKTKRLPIETDVYLEYRTQGYKLFNAKVKNNFIYQPTERQSSYLKDINIDKHRDVYPVLARFKEFIISCQSFEMLSPDRIKHSSRGKVSTIGRGGEKLAAFIRQFQNGAKSSFMSKVNDIVPNTVSITTSVRSRPGWVELLLKETFGDMQYSTKSNHISDGMLRIIALAALTEMPQKEGMVLLDEIEDGLNPHITSKIVAMLRAYVQDTSRQILLTTHSSVMLDDFKPEEILFVYRDENGFVKVKRAFTENEKLQLMLKYLKPGEIWLNVDDADLSKSTVIEK